MWQNLIMTTRVIVMMKIMGMNYVTAASLTCKNLYWIINKINLKFVHVTMHRFCHVWPYKSDELKFVFQCSSIQRLTEDSTGTILTRFGHTVVSFFINGWYFYKFISMFIRFGGIEVQVLTAFPRFISLSFRIYEYLFLVDRSCLILLDSFY